MATYNGARIDHINELVSRFTYDSKELPNAVAGALMTTAGGAAGIMRWRIMTAETRTGQRRAASGRGVAGRVKTGAMIGSIARNGHFADVSVYGDKIRTEFGYINDPPYYTLKQEFEYYSISGALMAQQLGFNWFMQHIYAYIAQAWRELDEDAKAKRFQSRSTAAYNRGKNLLDILEKSAPGV